ncbi:MAG: ZIP family metal transporter [Candidatus Saccharibacteria bacterium]
MIIVLIIFAAVISTALGGLFAIKFKDKLHLILGFGAGAILGVALFDLLPESLELTKGFFSVQVVSGLIAIGFAIFMLIDRFFSPHGDHDDNCENQHHKGQFGASAIILHSFLDGFSIGLAFKISPAIGGVVALAVLIHGFSDGVNTVNMIIKTKGKRKIALKWLAVDALAPALGVVSAYLMNVQNQILGLVMAFFIGLFLYISASDLIPESHHRHPATWTTISTIIGMIVIFLASTILS